MRRAVIGSFVCLFLAGSGAMAETLRVAGDRLFLPVEINGRPFEALLDSGAEMTVIDAAAAQRLGLEAEGSAQARGTGKGAQTARFVRGVEIRAAGIVLKDRTVAVLDLGDVARRLTGGTLSVVLGREFFDAGRLRLNIAEGRIEPVSKAAKPEGVRLPLSDHRGIRQIPVRIEGRKAVRADFDLGNGSEMLVGQDYARSIGLLAEDRFVAMREGGGIGGALERRIVRVERIEIAGVVFRDVEAAVDTAPGAPDANVGVALLRRFEMLIDFPGNAVWLKEAAGER